MDQLDVAITAGANQAFVNAALAICDSNDTACIIAPYYFSHKLSLQLANVRPTASILISLTESFIYSRLT